MKTRNLTLSALFAALMAICAWISFPLGGVPVTLQTFGVYLTLLVLGGKWGSISILVYLCLGAMGLPVFSGFQGGIGALLGPTGGFLRGFMLTALLFWTAAHIFGNVFHIYLISLLVGTILSYVVGFFQYSHFASSNFWVLCGAFFLPDLGKMALAFFLAKRLKGRI